MHDGPPARKQVPHSRLVCTQLLCAVWVLCSTDGYIYKYQRWRMIATQIQTTFISNIEPSSHFCEFPFISLVKLEADAPSPSDDQKCPTLFAPCVSWRTRHQRSQRWMVPITRMSSVIPVCTQSLLLGGRTDEYRLEMARTPKGLGKRFIRVLH
jgi:hypothetical protein